MKLLPKVTTLVVAVLTLLTFLTTAAPASAAPTTCTLTPKSVVLYDQPRTLTFRLRTSFSGWQVQPNELGIAIQGSTDEPAAKQVLDAAFLNRAEIGPHPLKFQLTSGPSGLSSCVVDFTVQRGSAISLSVRKVSGGRQLSGTLRSVDFGWAPGPTKAAGRGKATWSGRTGLKVKIQYRNPAGHWVTTKTVKTSAGGRFKLTSRLGRHAWRAVYGGSAADGPRTSKTVTG